MRIAILLRSITLYIAFLALSACTTTPEYSSGKSASDVPRDVYVLAIRQIYMVAEGLPENKKFVNGEPVQEANPSQNDQEVITLVKQTIIRQLRGEGYIVVEGQNATADLGLKFFVDYFPERWPLLDRTLSIRAHVYDAKGKLIFKTYSYKLTAGLIGALVGPDRDAFVSAAATDSAIKTIAEIQKGLKK